MSTAGGSVRCPANELAARATRPEAVLLHDLTLREGEQAASVAFTLDDRIAIAHGLDEAGIRRIQVGFSGRDDDAVAAIKASGVVGELSQLCVVFDDEWRPRMDASARAGTDVLLVLFRASDEQLALAGFDRERGVERVAEAVGLARSRFRRVVFQPSFATAADPDHLIELCRRAEAAGAHEIAVADTTGIASPEGVRWMVEALTGAVAIPIGVHLHDDYGLALANSIAAVQAGAVIVEVSVLGLGERAGNCATEECAVALEGLYRIPTGVRLDRLTWLAQLVAERSGVPVPSSKAIVGDDVFTQKLDIHVRVTRERPWLLEPFDPAVVGQRRALKLGRGSGPIAVRAKLQALGREVSDDLLYELVAFVDRRAVEQKGVVSDAQLLEALDRSV